MLWRKYFHMRFPSKAGVSRAAVHGAEPLFPLWFCMAEPPQQTAFFRGKEEAYRQRGTALYFHHALCSIIKWITWTSILGALSYHQIPKTIPPLPHLHVNENTKWPKCISRSVVAAYASLCATMKIGLFGSVSLATQVTYRAKRAASLMWKYLFRIMWLQYIGSLFYRMVTHRCLSRQTNVGCLIKTLCEKNIGMA